MSRGPGSRLLVAAVLMAAFGALTAVGSGATPSPVDVRAADFSFSPQNITVDVGGTVTWHISGGPHTITAEGGSFDSGSRSDGSVFEFTFSQPGSYAYYCQFHKSSGMTGVVEVRSASATTSTTDPPPTTTTRPHPTKTTRPPTTTTTQPATTMPPSTTTTWPTTSTTARPPISAPSPPPVDTTPTSNGGPAGKSHPSTTTPSAVGKAAAPAPKGHGHDSTTTGPPASMTPLSPLPALGESPTPPPAPPSGSQVQLVSPAAAQQPAGSPARQSALIIGLGVITLLAVGTAIRAWGNRSSRYWSA